MTSGFTELSQRIRREADKVIAEVTELRHALHASPETAFSEHRTAERVAELLTDAGLDVRTGVADTGVVATVGGDWPGGAIALRADMDALPLTDTSGKPYASRHDGLAHACGHDGHVAMLVGASLVLAALRNEISGEVRLLFQPAEESGMGARAMIDDGALGEPEPEAIFALHGWPGLPVGVVATLPGQMTAANDVFTLTVTGVGGHGARPNLARSPIIGAAELVRRISGLTNLDHETGVPRVVSVGSVHSGSRANVIPSKAVIEGTIRSSSNAVRAELDDEIRRIAREVADQRDLQVVFDVHMYCPAVVNDPSLFDLFTRTAGDLFGPDGWSVMEHPSMGSEDFAHYLQHVPGLLVRIGTGEAGGQLHAGDFDFADGALASGISLLAGLAIRASQGQLSSGERGSGRS